MQALCVKREDRMENDFVIDKCTWHVEAEAPEYQNRALMHFQKKYEVLLDFLRENDLLKENGFGKNIANWLEFEIRASDLTDTGLELFKLSHDKWNVSYGEENTNRHLAQWKRRLDELRSNT